jgi:hypothetical protein
VECAWNSVVNKAAGYGVDGSGFEPRWRQEVLFYTPVQTFPETHSASYTKSIGALFLG